VCRFIVVEMEEDKTFRKRKQNTSWELQTTFRHCPQQQNQLILHGTNNGTPTLLDWLGKTQVAPILLKNLGQKLVKVKVHRLIRN